MDITFANSQAPHHQYALPLLTIAIKKIENGDNSNDFFDLNILVEEDIKVLPDKDKIVTDNEKADNEDIDTSPKFIKANQNLWELRNPKWSLKKQISDYYLLSLSALIDPDKYQKHLNKRADLLSFQFARYTDMAVGGELRHTRNFIDQDKINELQVPTPLREALRDHTLASKTSYVSRHSAWQGWYHFRRQWGTVAIKWAVDTYRLEGWNGGYGGAKWATIANTLYMYETGKITQNSFIDTCFGLEHNNGNYFNKWWVGTLKPVLDANQVGCYCFLYANSSHIIKKLVDKKTVREMCSCLEDSDSDWCRTYDQYGAITGAEVRCH